MQIRYREVVAYTILSDYSTNGLTAHVTRFIANGWQPRGDVFTVEHQDQPEYNQTMVKYAVRNG